MSPKQYWKNESRQQIIRYVFLFIFALSLTNVACNSKPNINSTHVVVADRFAGALAKENFDKAHDLLTRTAKEMLPASALKKQYKEMTDYGSGPATHVEVIRDLSTWSGKQKDDVAWVYVAISGDNFSEAVTVIVTREDGQERIRSVEWGRP